ncbi:MAG TPA: B12-binding domain-containing radical SAM protein, partial [Armatimonadota bacterium]
MHSLLDEILPRVSKPARYTGGEYNAVLKDHGSVEVKIALAFPDVYDIGMSNLGLRILYHVMNKRSDTAAERVFTPWTDMEAEMRQHNLPLFALESRVPVKDFDIIGFSLGYELTYTNVLNMLDLAGIPTLAADRDDSYPLVIAGGCCAFNPEPMTDFIDAFVIGEGEEVVHEFIDAFKSHRSEGKQNLLHALAQIPGVYVPSLYEVSYNPDGTVNEIHPTSPDVPQTVTKRVMW